MTTRILVTDEVNDEHYALRCQSGCPIRGYGASVAEPANLRSAADIARFHAIKYHHVVEILDVSPDCRCASLDADLRPCEPCHLRLSPAAREGA